MKALNLVDKLYSFMIFFFIFVIIFTLKNIVFSPGHLSLYLCGKLNILVYMRHVF
ncbi:hypothetical protein Sjap_011619 [Stephania japonica]|uniref:Uncharacterized protein n=1 Tax=Stephania japonica TaxID=461633 RepID=A0AAP0JDV2_9MAGN